MSLPGAGPICSRLGTGPFLTAQFSGLIFRDFGSLLDRILDNFLMDSQANLASEIDAKSIENRSKN